MQLETDESLLLPKARTALRRYGHQIVIANDLHKRKHEVVFVSPKPATTPRSTPPTSPTGDATPSTPQDDADLFNEYWLRIPIPDASVPPHQVKEIEEDIVAELVKRHTEWIKQV